jgi:cellulose synthase/poly-beta-1,6-N-acetylglucosamine synthase-like glycosyltransferase
LNFLRLIVAGTAIVIPCYNESEKIQYAEFDKFYWSNDSICFCFVNDVITDGTQKNVGNFYEQNNERFQLINLQSNIGKAEAVRQGITVLLQSAQCKFVGFWDTDLATPLSAIVQFVKHIQSNEGLATVCG